MGSNKILITLFLSFILCLHSASAKTLKSQVMIMNLHMEDGKITLNSMNITRVRLSKKTKNINGKNFLVISNRSGKSLAKSVFKINKKLHFDYIDEKTGMFHGGEIIRTKVDFIIKIPYSKDMKKVEFFQKQPQNAKTSVLKMGSVDLPD